MKQLIAFFSALLLTMSGLCAQIVEQPVRWTLKAENTGGNIYEITATGIIMPAKWHIYDLTEYVDGPNATSFSVSGNGIEPLGEPIVLSEVKKEFNEIFDMEIGTCESPVVIRQSVTVSGESTGMAIVNIGWQCCDEASCLPPEEFESTVRLEPSAPGGNESLWSLIIQAILWGLFALLTPCVFPMIPMTVSFFLKQNSRWHVLLFGLFIVILYTIPVAVIILLTYLMGGASVTADIFNWLATHWLPNTLFFLIFMVFAASFFGAFEIRLPSRLVNKSDEKSDKGGLLGIFFVALTLVLVSFSCTGPIVGSVLIKSTQGQFWAPILTMLAFSLAFALPFTLFAFAPSLMKKLPKSGGWLGSVKIVLGFIEIALGLKFLSVVDQTYHWGILDREIYLAIWIVVFTLLGLYLLGKIRFNDEEEVRHIGIFRLILVIVDFSFVVYMIPGMWGAPLKGLSGYLPPITTQDFVIDRFLPVQADDPSAEGKVHKYSDLLQLPYGIPAYFDYDEAREAAISESKPLLVDFTGHGCVNCREMESRVWSDPRVLKMMTEDYIVCALYADDKTVLPQEEWVTLEDGKVLKSLGRINSHLALTRFNVNAQPYYAILDPVTEKLKMPGRGYNLDIEAFVEFLSRGKR